jgi:hypothetical protein
MSGAYSTREIGKNCVQSFGRKPQTLRPRYKCKNNTKIDLKERGRVWTGCIWLRLSLMAEVAFGKPIVSYNILLLKHVNCYRSIKSLRKKNL